MWWLALIGMAAGAVVNYISGEANKESANESAENIRKDLDTLLGTETEKLTAEYNVQQKRLEDYTTSVLGSQRQGFAVRGDFGGVDTAAAKLIQTTENKSAEDQALLQKSFELAKETLTEQTQLAKDQLDSSLNQYLSGVTANQITGFTNLVTNSLGVLASMKLPTSTSPGAPTVMDYDSLTRSTSVWDSEVGIPRLVYG